MSSFLSLGIIDMWRMSMNNLMIVFRNTMNNVGLYLEYKVQEDHPPYMTNVYTYIILCKATRIHRKSLNETCKYLI